MTCFQPAPDVGAIEDGDRVFAAVLPDGPILVLTDLAASVWRAARGADLEGIAAALTAEGASSEDRAEADAEMYVSALLEAGLLRQEEEA